MRCTFLFVFVVALSACSTAGPATTSPADAADAVTAGERATLSRVLDGDSIAVRLADGSDDEVRLIGINAPEGDECHGDAAREALGGLLEDGELILVADEEDRDRFGRRLRYVFTGETNVNLQMATGGDALALQTGHRLEQAFLKAARNAAASGIGLWSPIACGDRDLEADIRIEDYEYDPPGRDADNPNDEWVDVANRGDRAVDLSGWTIRDESTLHRFVLPNGFELGPGEVVRIRSGCGASTADDLYWCASDPVWSNGGDTIILQLPGGTIVAWVQYPGDF